MDLRPDRLVLRCYAENVSGQWQAFCLDLSLASQADTFEEAQGKLRAMIAEYVYDALSGEDRLHADMLLSRKAPWRDRVKYHAYVALHRFGMLAEGLRRLFFEILPLRPPDPTARPA
jgi:hypothetical protein